MPDKTVTADMAARANADLTRSLEKLAHTTFAIKHERDALRGWREEAIAALKALLEMAKDHGMEENATTAYARAVIVLAQEEWV